MVYPDMVKSVIMAKYSVFQTDLYLSKVFKELLIEIISIRGQYWWFLFSSHLSFVIYYMFKSEGWATSLGRHCPSPCLPNTYFFIVENFSLQILDPRFRQEKKGFQQYVTYSLLKKGRAYMVPNGTLFSNKLVPINATNIHSPYSPYSP